MAMRGSRNFFAGGPGPVAKKQSGKRFFFVLFFKSSTYFTVYRGGLDWHQSTKCI